MLFVELIKLRIPFEIIRDLVCFYQSLEKLLQIYQLNNYYSAVDCIFVIKDYFYNLFNYGEQPMKIFLQISQCHFIDVVMAFLRAIYLQI